MDYAINQHRLVLALLCAMLSDGVLAADIKAGEMSYNQCIGCHSFAYHRTGPKHCNLFGRIVGSAEGFLYSDAMRNSEIQWDSKSLNKFLASPLSFIPGTSMGFVGIKDAKERKNLVAYIKVQSESDQCNP